MPAEPVTVATFPNVEEAHIAKNYLESEGITAFLADDAMMGIAWYLGNAVGGVKLLVAQEQAERAVEILDNLPNPEAEDEAFAEPTPEPSEECEPDDRDLAAGAAQAPIAQEESEEDRESPAEQMVTRAFRAAILGIIVVPPLLNIFSLWLLSKAANVEQTLSPKGKAKHVVAFVFDLLVIGVVGLVLVGMFLLPGRKGRL